MNIGPGIFLVALGAVMAFAVNSPTDSVDVAVVGWILMAAGAILIRLDFVEFVPRRRTTVPAAAEMDPAEGDPAATAPPAAAPAAQAPPAQAPAAQAPPAQAPPAQAPPAQAPPAQAPAAPAPVPAPRQSMMPPTPGSAGPAASPLSGHPHVQGPPA